MIIIAGLGNPGRQYENTRHNSGFAALDILAERTGIAVRTARFDALTGQGVIRGQKVLLLKPQTYMNLSGRAVRAACAWYGVDPASQLIVIYDDISLAPGRIRVRQKGSAGGHNGMKSIIGELGTQEFLRVRIGVGEKPEGYDLADYVLGRFPLGERADMETAFDLAGRAAMDLLDHPAQDVMSAYNGN